MATFSDAVNSIGDGNAAKREAWHGYVYRKDTDPTVSTYPAWVESKSYSVNDKVSVTADGVTSYYICTTAHKSASTFDSDVSNWESVSVDSYTITFKEYNNVDGDTADEYAFTFEPTASSGSVVFECTSAPSVGLTVDKDLMTALLATDWTTGSTDVFEKLREGSTTKRW